MEAKNREIRFRRSLVLLTEKVKEVAVKRVKVS